MLFQQITELQKTAAKNNNKTQKWKLQLLLLQQVDNDHYFMEALTAAATTPVNLRESAINIKTQKSINRFIRHKLCVVFYVQPLTTNAAP